MSDSLTLRPTVAGDLDALVALSAAVAWPHRAADLQLMLQLGRGVAAVDAASGVTVGVGFWWPNGRCAATLGLMIVSPERQGRGIGGRVMRALLDDARPRAVKLVATAAGRPLYERLGFRAIGLIRQQQGNYGAQPALRPPMRPAERRDLEALVALDAEAIGAERGALISRLIEAGEVVLLDGASAPAGFAIRRAFGRGEVIGPIVAPDEDGAIELFRAVVKAGFVRVDCPATAVRFSTHLAGAGLHVVDEPLVMLHGDWPPLTGRVRSFALVSQALG